MVDRTLTFTSSDGLLSTFTDAAQHPPHIFDWDTDGRLKRDSDPAGEDRMPGLDASPRAWEHSWATAAREGLG